MQFKNQFFRIVIYIALALGLRFLVVDRILEGAETRWLQAAAIALIFGIGIGYVFRGTAKVIEETTDVLKDRTKLAGGLLQAFGTAFPDMVIGVVACPYLFTGQGYGLCARYQLSYHRCFNHFWFQYL